MQLRRSAFAGVIALAALAATTPTSARAQTSDAAIAGSVRALNGEPLAGATVTVRNEATGFQRAGQTNASGRFLFPAVPLGGPYSVTVRVLGYRPETKRGYTLSLSDRLAVDFALQPAAVQLEAEVVTADAGNARAERIGASTQISPRELRNLPAINRNFTDLANLAPTTNGINVGGQRTTATDIRLDGVQSRNMLTGGGFGRGPYSVSIESLREFELVTNVYDVTQGRQGGGGINAATRSGTNAFEGSLFAYHRNENLTTQDYTGREPTDFANTQWGGSLGGPIVRDRLHFYTVFDRQDLSEPYFVADARDAEDEVQLGIARDSLTRLLGILQDGYGLGADQQVGQFQRKAVLNTFFGRLDWTATQRHRATLRYNYSDWINPGSIGGDQSLSLYESRGTLWSREHQAMASVQSALGQSAANELKLAFNTRQVENREFSRVPRGFVRVRSELPNGTTGDTRVQFGGNRISPEWQRDWQLQLLNTTTLSRGNSTFRFGLDNTLSYISMYISIEQGGLFEFESLRDLETFTPFRYSRQVPLRRPEPDVGHYVFDGGLFAQAEFRPTPRLTALLGLRYDVSSFLTAPERNPLLEQELGIRSDRTATDANNLQPRAQLTWDIRGTGREILRVGAGVFSAQPHYYAHINHMLNTGVELGEVVLTGADVPRPDFPAYRNDLAAVPGVPAGAAQRPAYVNVLSPDYQVPTNYKADASYQRRFGRRLSLGVTGQWSRVVNNYHYFDRNLVDEPFFRLENEGGRGVFVPAATIDARGRTNNVNSRKTPALARVLEFRPGAELRQRAAILEGSLQLPREALVAGSFTLNSTRDNSSYNCCIARTASFTAITSDPRDLSGSWGPADNDFRHKVVLYGQLPSVWGFRLSGRYVGQSGQTFSLLVNGDINGDDHNNNDLAFVFDPDDPNTPPEIAEGMRRVLANPKSRAREYIRANLGRIAGRNGGRGPFAGRLDLRLARQFPTLRGQSAELTVDVFNFANLLNSDWGGRYVVPRNQFLLNVVGFDPATQRYRYAVNENVGVVRKTGAPYQIQAGVRYGF